MEQYSALGRPINPRYPTNLAILILTPLAIIAAGFIQLISGAEILASIGVGAASGFAFFASWALAREIDPDYPYSAFVAAGLTLIGVITLETPTLLGFLALFLLIQLTRVVNRTVGPAATTGDTLVVVIFTGFMAFIGSWLYAVLGALALLFDNFLPAPNKRHRVFAGVLIVIAAIAFVTGDAPEAQAALSLPSLVAISLISLAFIPVIVLSKQLTCKTDLEGYTLYPRRVQMGQILFLLAGYHFALWQGDAGVLSLLTIWTTILGVAVYRLIAPFVESRSTSEISTGGQPHEPTAN